MFWFVCFFAFIGLSYGIKHKDPLPTDIYGIPTQVIHNECEEDDDNDDLSGIFGIDSFPEKIHMELDTFVNALAFPKNSPIQSRNKTKTKTTLVNLSGLTAFEGIVDEESLNDALDSIVGLCMYYYHVNKGKKDEGYLECARGTGFWINETHILTARHNTYECVRKTLEDKLIECVTLADFQSSDRYILDTITISRYNFDCESSLDIEKEDIIRIPYDDATKGSKKYYGKTVAGFFADDLALIKMPVKSKKYFELIDASSYSLDDMKHLVVVGYPPEFESTEAYALADSKQSQIPGTLLNQFFGGGKKIAIGITDEKMFSAVNELPESSYFIFHRVPTWSGFSGSPLFYVDSGGKLQAIGVHVGGYGDWNAAIMFNHPFSDNLKSIADKDEL